MGEEYRRAGVYRALLEACLVGSLEKDRLSCGVCSAGSLLGLGAPNQGF